MHWKWLIGSGFAGGFLAASLLAWQIHDARIEAVKKSLTTEKEAAVAAKYQECVQAQKITYELGEKHDREIATINQRHAAIVNRLRSEALRVVAVPSPSLADHAAGGDGVSGVVGVDAVAVANKFRTCDEQAERLITAQEVIRAVK